MRVLKIEQAIIELNKWVDNSDKALEEGINKLEELGNKKPLYTEKELLEHQSYIITLIKDKLKELHLNRREF